MTEPEARINEISRCLSAIGNGWPLIAMEISRKLEEHIASLIEADNEQTRGRIKALTAVLELPQTLSDERDGISAGLSEQDPAD